MSGIAIVLNRDGSPVSIESLQAMTSAMSYRGPDGIAFKLCGHVGLGQCHMKTTPEAAFESLPLVNESGDVSLVLAGRADNRVALRRALVDKGVLLRDVSDAELILRAYETWGRGCVDHIDGDFAFAVWDARSGKLFCARDRFGAAPFFYWCDDRIFVAASDISALVSALPASPRANLRMLAQYLIATFFTPEETVWSGILRLMPAHRLEVSEERISTSRYWSPDVHAVIHGDERELIERYLAVLRSSVTNAAHTIGPAAVEVSGGLDSSAVFAVAHHLAAQGSLTASDIIGYTLNFNYETDANELAYADAVGDFLGRPINRVEPSRFPLDWHEQQIRRTLDFPSRPNGVMGLGIREAARSAGSRVLLVGIGGDEWLDGSWLAYAEELQAGRFSDLWKLLRIDASIDGWRTVGLRFLRFGVYPLAPESLRSAIRRIYHPQEASYLDLKALLSPELQAVFKKDHCSLASAAPDVGRVGQRALMLMLKSVFSCLAREREEQLAAMAGIEIRRPLFSTPIVDFAFATSENSRRLGGVNRGLHRAAMKGLLPELVRTRTSKANFMDSFRWHMLEIEQWLETGVRTTSLLAPDAARDLMCSVGRSDLGGWPELILWNLFALETLREKAM